jgi:prepilin-type N-terminal cleavage/methylation domain-containing protein
VRTILFKRNPKGFTLLDLLMVIFILGILGMVGLPRFHSMIAQATLNSAASDLCSALMVAEDLAVTHQRPFGVRGSVADNRFEVFDNRYKADASPHHDEDPPVDSKGVVLNPVDKKWYVQDFDLMEDYQGVKITSVPAGEEICFYPDGHSSAGDSSFVLSLGGDQRTVTVVGATGAISVQ